MIFSFGCIFLRFFTKLAFFVAMHSQYYGKGSIVRHNISLLEVLWGPNDLQFWLIYLNLDPYYHMSPKYLIFRLNSQIILSHFEGCMTADLELESKNAVCYALEGGPGMPNNNPRIIGPLSKWENSPENGFAARVN